MTDQPDDLGQVLAQGSLLAQAISSVISIFSAHTDGSEALQKLVEASIEPDRAVTLAAAEVVQTMATALHARIEACCRADIGDRLFETLCRRCLEDLIVLACVPACHDLRRVLEEEITMLDALPTFQVVHSLEGYYRGSLRGAFPAPTRRAAPTEE